VLLKLTVCFILIFFLYIHVLTKPPQVHHIC